MFSAVACESLRPSEDVDTVYLIHFLSDTLKSDD